jgi:hypothetical protein
VERGYSSKLLGLLKRFAPRGWRCSFLDSNAIVFLRGLLWFHFVLAKLGELVSLYLKPEDIGRFLFYSFKKEKELFTTNLFCVFGGKFISPLCQG